MVMVMVRRKRACVSRALSDVLVASSAPAAASSVSGEVVGVGLDGCCMVPRWTGDRGHVLWDSSTVDTS